MFWLIVFILGLILPGPAKALVGGAVLGVILLGAIGGSELPPGER